MEPLERAANLSVARACGFGALAILCFMVGFSYQPMLSARIGGSMALLTCAILLIKAWLAPTTPYKSTETWLMLGQEDRPPAETAQQLIGETLRRVFLDYARFSALVAITLLGSSVLLGVFSR
jgi:multisubunit Na+/H+ antiporter MnhB subunit